MKNYPKFFLPLLLLSFVFLPSFTGAQGTGALTSDGRDFYLGIVPPTYLCSYTLPYEGQYAVVSSYYGNNSITMSYFNPSTGEEIVGKTYSLDSLGWVQIKLDPVFMAFDSSGNRDTEGENPKAYQACHLHSKRPVSVQYYSTGPVGGASYLALPTPVLGKHYVAMCLPSNPGNGAGNSFYCTTPYHASSLFQVIGTEDSTHVRIVATAETSRLHVKARDTIRVTLERGQCYMVKASPDGTDDLSGSQIFSDKPIAVIAGNEGAANGETFYHGTLEERDISLEMMVPVEYWSAEGHFSMPFVDSAPHRTTDPSNGEGYKVFAPFPQTTVDFEIDAMGTRTSSVEPYKTPAYIQNVETGINARSDGQPIFVEQYDYSQHNTAEPYPSPSQMNVVPWSEWRTSCMWSIPDDALIVHKHHYINVIGYNNQFDNGRIKIAINGKSAVKIISLPSVGSRAVIPGHPELSGRRFEVNPGSYYAFGDSAFVVYTYGMLGLNLSGGAPSTNGSSYYYSCASPAGQSFRIDGATTSSFEVDTICAHWRVSVQDTGALNHGVALIELLNDAAGVSFRPPYVSYNTSLSEPKFTKGDTVVLFDVKVIDPWKDAYAAVLAVNGAGNGKVCELHYKAIDFDIKPNSLEFLSTPIDSDSCSTITFHNKGQKTVSITDALFVVGGQGFSYSPNNFPYHIAAGDSTKFSVCFSTDQAEKLMVDTLRVLTECLDLPVFLAGSGATPSIFATDLDFGTIRVDQTKCLKVHITNIGTSPLTLTKQWALNRYRTFPGSFAFADTVQLPHVLDPDESVDLTFCFSPKQIGHDTAWMHWGTNILDSIAHDLPNKNYSTIRGEAVDPMAITNEPSLQELSLTVHPNPAIGSVEVQLSRPAESITLLDVLGREVSNFELRPEQLSTSLDLKGRAPGTYFIRARSGDQIVTQRLVIVR